MLISKLTSEISNWFPYFNNAVFSAIFIDPILNDVIDPPFIVVSSNSIAITESRSFDSGYCVMHDIQINIIDIINDGKIDTNINYTCDNKIRSLAEKEWNSIPWAQSIVIPLSQNLMSFCDINCLKFFPINSDIRLLSKGINIWYHCKIAEQLQKPINNDYKKIDKFKVEVINGCLKSKNC